MKRYLLAAVLVLALALPLEAAAGGSTRYPGPIAEGGTVKFKVVKRDGRRFVVRFRWRNFVVQCDAGATPTAGVFTFPIRVRDGAFRARGEPPEGGLARVRGEFFRHPRRAEGTLRIEGDIPEGDNCFGRSEWRALRE